VRATTVFSSPVNLCVDCSGTESGCDSLGKEASPSHLIIAFVHEPYKWCNLRLSLCNAATVPIPARRGSGIIERVTLLDNLFDAADCVVLRRLAVILRIGKQYFVWRMGIQEPNATMSEGLSGLW
jgi:hypothetical protein